MIISTCRWQKRISSVAEKAIEPAQENLRMTEERYKYQVATQTDVIIAVTLLTQAKTQLLWRIE